MPNKVTPERYNLVAVILHWVMALAFFGMLFSGFLMTDHLEFIGLSLEQSDKFKLFQIHKSTGLILLVAFILRLGWRLFHPTPAMPESMPKAEKMAAKAGHWALYFWMFALPMTGWVMVSSSSYGLPTLIYGLFEWPHLPGIAGNKQVNGASSEAHELLAYAFMALIAGHILAVIKHLVIDKENLIARMWVGKKDKE